jgi:hypothetical protein
MKPIRAIICKRVRDGADVCGVANSGDCWQMLCNDIACDHTNADYLLLVHASHIFDRDKSLSELRDLPVGYSEFRQSANAPWEGRQPLPPECG